jgi:hypothetical protein
MGVPLLISAKPLATCGNGNETEQNGTEKSAVREKKASTLNNENREH